MIDVTGTSMWAQVFEWNRDMGSKPGDKYDYDESTQITLVLDQEELKKVSAQNPDVSPKITDDGLAVKFRRSWVNNINAEWGGPPVVKDADGNPWPEKKAIGNGSKVRVIAQPYKHKHGNSMRLMAVQVLELVEAPEFEDDFELPF